METIIFLSVITVLVLVGIALSIVLIKKNKNSDSGIISDKLGIYEKKLETYEKNLKPIWHNLTKKQVIDFSPIIADRKAATTALQTPAGIAQEIKDLFENGE